MAYPEYNSCIASFSASPKDFVCYICPEKIGTSLEEHKNDEIHCLNLQYFFHHFNDAGRLIQCKTCGIFFLLEDLIKHAQIHKIIPWFRPDRELEILFKNIISCSNKQYYCHICDIKFPFWFLAISHTQGADHKNCLSVKIGESLGIENVSLPALAKLCVENFIFINERNVFFCFICKDDIETSGIRIIEHTSNQKHKKKEATFKNYLKSAKCYELSFDTPQIIDPVYNHNDQLDIIISICTICGMKVARNAIDSHLEIHEKNISTSKNGQTENEAHSHTMPENVDSVGASCSTWKIDENKEVITFSNSIGNELHKSIIEKSNNVPQTDKSTMEKHTESGQLRDGTTHNVKPESIVPLNGSVSASQSSLKSAGSPNIEASSSECQSNELSSECASDRTTKNKLIEASPTTPISKAEPIDLSSIQEITFTKCETCDKEILCDPENILRHTTSTEHKEKLTSQAITIYGKHLLIEPIFTQSHDKFFIIKPNIESFGDLMEILMVPPSNNGKFAEIFYWCKICESKLHDIPDNHVKSKNIEEHVKGGKHKEQLVAKKTADSDKSSLTNAISPQDIPPKESTFLERMLTSSENSTENIDILESNLPEGIITAENESILYCNICQCTFGNSNNIEQHVMGRKHKSKLIEQEAPGSEKSFLLNCKQPTDVLQGVSVSVNRKSTSTNNSTHNMDICQTLSECMTTTKTEEYVNELEHMPEGIEAFGKRRLCTICNCWILKSQSTNDHIATIDHVINGPKVINRIKAYSFECEVCQCDIPNIQTLKQHLGSIDHQSKKNKKYPVDKEIKRQRLYGLPKHMVRVANDSRFLCKICKRMIPGTSTHAARHIESKSHTENLKELEEQQRDRSTVSKLSSEKEITTTLSSNPIESNIDFNVEKYGLARVYIGRGGSRKNLPEGIERFSARNCLYCTICCCKIQGSMSIDDHIATINHKTKGPKVINSIGNGVLQCQVCDCKIQGLPYLQEHLASSKHLSNKTVQSGSQDFAKNNIYDLPEGIMRIDDRNGFLCEICSHMIPPTLEDAMEHVKEEEHRRQLRHWQAFNVFLNEKEAESGIRSGEQIIISVGNNQSFQRMPVEQKVPIDFNDIERSYADIIRGLIDVQIRENQDSSVDENSVEHINSDEEATEAIHRVPKTSMITKKSLTNGTRTKSRKSKKDFKCSSCHIKFLNYGELHAHMTEHFLPRFDANSTEEGRQLAEISMKDLSNQLNDEEDVSEDSEDNDSIEEMTNINVNHGLRNRQLDIDRGNGFNIYEVHYKKKEYLRMGILLTIPKRGKKFYCLACQKTMKFTIQFYYDHLCSLHHLDCLQDMLDDHSLFENCPRELSDLALAYEYMEGPKGNYVKCHSCKIALLNKNFLLHKHIKSDTHVNSWEILAAKNEALANIILHIFQYDFYMVRKYWCVLCNCRYTSECEFRDHMYTKKHKKAIAKFSDMGQMLIYDYCAVCATLWFGFVRTYSYHITGAMHKYHIDKDFYLVRQLPLAAERLLYSPDQRINMFLMEIEKSQPKNKRKEGLLIRDLESVAKEKYPNCVAYTFGSRTTKLGGTTSDLDIFLDCSTKKYPVYKGQNSSIEEVQERLKAIKSCLLKHPQVWLINQDISNARTPIIKAVHLPTGIGCDLSFTNGLAVEETKLVNAYCEKFPNCRRLIVFIEKWMAHCDLDGSSGIHSCGMAWMVIFFLQRKTILPTVAELIAKKNQSRVIGGWEVGVDFDFDVIDTREPIENLLVQFFRFYAKFDYRNQIICPLLGEPVDKTMIKQKQRIPSEMKQYRYYLQSNKIAEPFCFDSILCIQDPFDLSHNITKATKKRLVYRLKTFCELSGEYLDHIIIKHLRARAQGFPKKSCHKLNFPNADILMKSEIEEFFNHKKFSSLSLIVRKFSKFISSNGKMIDLN